MTKKWPHLWVPATCMHQQVWKGPMKMTPLEADPCFFMPTSVQNLEIVSFAVSLPSLLNYKSSKSPSNVGVAEDIKQSLTWGIDSHNSLLWWNGVVFYVQLYFVNYW